MKQFPSTIKRFAWQFGLASLVLANSALRASAQDIWTGGGADANWSTAANWQAGTAPVAGDTLDFTGSTQTSPNNDFTADTAFGGLLFDNNAATFTLTGNEITLSGLVENDATNTLQTLALPLHITAPVTFNSVSNDLSGSGYSNNILVGLPTGGINGTGSLIKMGPGSLEISNKTYSGGTTISNGLLIVDNDNGSYTLSGGSLLLTYGSWYSTPTFTFTADSWLGVQAGGPDYNSRGRYDFYGNLGSPGFKWTVFGTGRFQFAGGSNHLLASSTEVTAPAVLSDVNGGNTTLSGLGTNLITVDNGAALRKNNGGIVQNPIVLDGGAGPDNTSGALIANEEAFAGQPQTIVATFNNNITLLNDNGDTTLGVQYGSMAISGNISGPGGLVKVGPNLLNLSGTNTYAGNTTISQGTLQLGSPLALTNNSSTLYLLNAGMLDLAGNSATVGSLYDDGQAQATINNSSATPVTLTLVNGGSFTGTVGNSGGGALSFVNVAGATTLSGVNTFSGGLSVLGGSFELQVPTGVTTGGGLLNLADGTTLTLDYRVANSSLRATGATLNGPASGITLNVNLANFGNPGNPVINATNGTGVLNASGVVTINITGTDNLSVGQFPLIKYLAHTGSGSFVLGNLGAGITAQIVTNAANKSIDLQITSAPITTWAGYKNDLWDYSTTNWSYSGIKVLYTDGSAVLFNDTAATNTVNLTTTLTPGPIQVLTTNTYTFVGAGALSGGNLTKNGSGTLILDTTNASTYNNTIISAGTLQIGNNDGNGSLGGGTVDDEGTLSFNNTNAVAVANTISGAGALVKNNTNTVTISGGNSYTGSTVINQGILRQTLTNSLGLPLPGTPVATVVSGAALSLGGASIFATNPVVINGFGTGVANTGALYNDAGWSYLGGTEMGANAVSLASDASVGGPGNWFAIGNNGVNGLAGNGHNLTKVGAGTLAFKAAASSALASFTIAGGSVLFYNHNVSWLGTGATLIYTNNTSSDSWDPNNWTGINVVNNIIIASNGGQINNTHGAYYGQANQDIYSGNVALNGTLTLHVTSTYTGNPNPGVPTYGKQTFSGAISGAGGITATVTTGDSVVLSGANTYTGPTVNVGGANGGTISLSASQQGGGAYTNNDNGILDIPSQTGGITVPISVLALGSSTGATLSLARVISLNPTNAPVTATNLVLTGVNSIILPGVAFANAGEFPIIKYGTLTGTIANLALGAAGARGIPGYLTNNVTNGSIDLVVPGGTPVVWTGSVNNGWDLATTANWVTNGVATVYQAGDAVTFNETSTVTNVSLTTPVSPSLLIVNNTNKFYTFTGSAITGSTVLLKQGTGTLLLTNGANSFTGGATIVGGTVKLGNAGSLNNSSGTVNVSGNGALDFNNQNPTALACTISGAGFNGLGTLVANYTNAATTYGPASITLAGNATIGGTNRWDMRSGVNQLNCPTNAYSLTKVGSGLVALVGTTVSPNLGNIYVLGGQLGCQLGATLGNPTNTIYLGGGSLEFYQASVPVTKNIVCSNSSGFVVDSGSGQQNTISGQVSVVSGASVTFNANNNSLIFTTPIAITNGTIAASGNPFFAGGLSNIISGTVTLTGSSIFGGAVNIPSGSTLQFNGNYYNTLTLSNVLSGSGNFGIQYQSYVKLAASNTFSGNITVPQCNAGNNGAGNVLYLIGNGSITHVPSISLQGFATGQAYAATLNASGRVDGSLNLAAGQTLRGDLASAVIGTLVVGAGSTVNVGGDFNTNYQYMNISNLTTKAGGIVSLDVSSTTNDQLHVAGVFNESAGGIIRVIYSSLPVGRYHLVTFGSKTGSAANLSLVLDGPQYTASLDDSTTPNTLDLVISSATPLPPNSLVWAGDGVNNYWDLGVSPDWLNSGAASVFHYGDNVSFTDPGTNPVVNLSTTLIPNSVTVNSAANYVFSGSGSIAGGTSLTKNGTGTLVINTANTFSNGTVINGGAIVLGNVNALWNNTNSAVTVNTGATLDMGGFNPNALTVNVSGAGVNGSGALVSSYSGVAQGIGPSVVNLLGSTTFGGSNRWDIRSGLNQLNSPTTNYVLTKVSTNFIALVGTTVSTNLGDIRINAGTLGYETGTTGLGNPTNTIFVGATGVLEMYQASVPLNKNIVLTNGASIQPDSGGGSGGPTTTQNILAGPIYLSGGTASINCNYNNGCAISNSISGPGGLLFGYNAYNRLYSPNTYQGDTTVDGGVYLYASSSIASTNNILINGGPLFATNNATVGVGSSYLNVNLGGLVLGGNASANYQTLQIAGTGYLNVTGRVDQTFTLSPGSLLRPYTGGYILGNLAVASGSTLSPGGSGSEQTLVVYGNVSFQAGGTNYADVNKTAAVTNCDVITLSGTANYGGTLEIQPNGTVPLVVGDSFRLVNATNGFTGNFTSVVSAPGSNLGWSFNPTNGVATVVSVLPATGTNITFSVSGNQLTLSWPSSYQGWLLQSNNAALNITNDWFTVPGSASTTQQVITLDPTQTNVFYRMVHP